MSSWYKNNPTILVPITNPNLTYSLNDNLWAIMDPIIERYRNDPNISNDALVRFLAKSLAAGEPWEDVQHNPDEARSKARRSYAQINDLVNGKEDL